MFELDWVKLGLAVLLITAVNRFFRKRNAVAPRETGANIPGRPVNHGFDWEDYWKECGNNAMQRLHDDMDRDCEEFIERTNDNRYRIMDDHRY